MSLVDSEREGTSQDSEDDFDPIADLTTIDPETLDPKRDFLREAMNIERDISSILVSRSFRTSKTDKERLSNLAAAFLGIITTQNTVIHQLRGRLHEKAEQMKASKPSYASVVTALLDPPRDDRNAGHGERGLGERGTKEHVLLVYPKDEQRSSEDTRNEITGSIDPIKLKIGVKRVNKIRKGGIVVQVTREEDIEKLQRGIENSAMGDKYSCTKPKSINPRLILYGVSEEIDKENLIQKLREQNQTLENAEMEVCFPLRAREGNHLVITTDPDTFHKIIYLGKLNLGWKRVGIKEFVKVTQCFNCFKYGHIAKLCNNKAICANCSREGHKSENCKIKPSCTNCVAANETHRFNLTTDHSATSSFCETYQWEREKITKRINYG
nr:uncharacterized protein LOC122273753 [Parasteatoda tepidariorum]